MPRNSLAVLSLLGAVSFVPALLAAQPGPPPRPEATVSVDCNAGETLAEALTTRADSLIIEFSGTCAEELVITRDRLTLRGLDPSATVTADPAASGPNAILLLHGADVVFEGFTVEGSRNRGIRVQRSSGVQLVNMTVRNNAVTGLTVEESSSAHLVDSSFTGNGFAGVAAWGSSNVTLTGDLEVSGNGVVGLLLTAASSFLGRNAGVIVADDQIFCVGTQVGAIGFFPRIESHNCQFAVVSFGGAHFGPVEVVNSFVGIFVTNNGSFDGPATVTASNRAVWLIDNAKAFLRGGSLSAPTALFSFNSLLEATNSTMAGDIDLQFNSRAFFTASSTSGAVTCDPTAVAGGSISCPSTLAGGQGEGEETRGGVAPPHALPLTQPE